ncbi:MAG TPA: porin, partial [Agitococcus sp.]|nr:porin [Agitococcus sp.]
MKRQLLAVAIAAATLLPLTAQAAPTVYGRLNLSVDYMDQDTGIAGVDGKVWELNSNSSRIGVKGNEKLTEEFTAVYKAEWEVQGDMAGKMNKAGETVDLGGRERYIGLKHFQWGTVRLGHIDSPFKNAEDDIDVFNDTAHLDMGKFIYGQNRLENSINYVSPKFLDVFGVNLTLQPGEGNAKNPSTGAGINENHIADAIS